MSCTTFHGKDKRFETLLIDDWHTLADMYVIARGVPGGDAGDGGAKAHARGKRPSARAKDATATKLTAPHKPGEGIPAAGAVADKEGGSSSKSESFPSRSESDSGTERRPGTSNVLRAGRVASHL